MYLWAVILQNFSNEEQFSRDREMLKATWLPQKSCDEDEMHGADACLKCFR